MKTHIRSIFLVILCLLALRGVSQQANNQFDDNGKKTGFWIENDGLIEVYYADGLRDGVFKAYYKINGKLAAFGEYSGGEKSGVWYYFDESSYMIIQESDISKNVKHTILRDDNVEITPKHTSYVRLYYPNSTLKEEGWVLYDEDIEMDYFKIGTWKYYSTDGDVKLVKEK